MIDDIGTELRTQLRTTQVPHDEALAGQMIGTAMAGGRDNRRLASASMTVPVRLNPDLGVDRRRRMTRYLVPIAAAATVVAVASVSVTLASVDRHGPARHPAKYSAAAPGAHQPPSAKPRVSTTPTGRPVGGTAVPGNGAPIPADGPLPPSAAVDLTWRFNVHPVPGYDIGRVSITNTVQVADINVSGHTKGIGSVDVFAAGALRPGKLSSKGAAVTVNAKPAYFGLFHVPDPYDLPGGQDVEMPTLGWQYADGAWAVVTGAWGMAASGETYDMAVARAAEQTIADAVDTSVTSPLRVDFTLGWLPAGLVVENGVNSSTAVGTGYYPETQLGLSDGKQRDRSYPGAFWGSAITVIRQHHLVNPKGGAPVPNITVDGKPGRYDEGGLTVTYPDGTELQVQVDPMHLNTFSKDDLIKIVHNASVTPKPTDPATWVPASEAVPH